MQKINIHEAKTHLSSLVEKAAEGESFIIAKAGRPLVMVTPLTVAEPRPRTGFLRGCAPIPEDFDRMGEQEIAAMFEGKP